MTEETKKNNERIVVPSEYPLDKDFARISGVQNVENGVRYADIFKDFDVLDAFNDLQTDRARENTEYIFSEASEADIQAI